MWVDSGLSFASTWLDEEVILERAQAWDGLVQSVGHVIYESDDRLVLGLSHDKETGNWSGAFLIYKPAIVDREKLGAPVS